MKIIILGGGVTGCVAARELATLGNEVIIIEKNDYLGGGCHTFFWGGHPYTEGPRPLVVTDEKIYNYINDIVPMRKFHLYADSYVESDKKIYSFPIHWDDIPLMPDKDIIYEELENLPENPVLDNLEDGWISEVGPTLYKKFIKTYTKKMWDVESNKVFSEYHWSIKGTKIQKGERFVQEPIGTIWEAYPIEETGYNRFFDYCTKDAMVIFGQEAQSIDLESKTVYVNGEKIEADVIISTISLDDLFGNEYGKLRYMGRDFYPIILPIERVFTNGHHFLYYPNSEKYTRIVEYKNITLHEAPDTLLIMETPSHKNRLYPYGITTEKEKAKKYLDSIPDGVYSIGRLGTYQYLNIGECIEMVWDLMKNQFK